MSDLRDTLPSVALKVQNSTFEFRNAIQAEDLFIPSTVFSAVLENLVRNPNITSSHLFRADVLYDSSADFSYDPLATTPNQLCKLAGHMQQRFRPRLLTFHGYALRRTIVREMVPRNPNRDARLPQTCHFYDEVSVSLPGSKTVLESECGGTLVVFLPHVDRPDDMPWYHPHAAAVAFLLDSPQPGRSRISIHIVPLPTQTSEKDAARLDRTLQNLLSTTTRHCRGRLAGYTKRVQHDAIVPQARVQDTYTRLKTTYAKSLTESWVEVTDPTKHVFEDLAIAAFLIEIWKDLYAQLPACERSRQQGACKNFNFVDIGCGNGLLVHILRSEGYEGWGFDVRARKSWDNFGPSTASCLTAATLVPAVFGTRDSDVQTHDGIFASNTFIISNHADELTAWTPILARLSGGCSFLAIPCCSHDLGGSRTRFKPQPKPSTTPLIDGAITCDGKNPDVSAKGPSAYATLCDYLVHIAQQTGYEARREMLRIPSTRNVGILGTVCDIGGPLADFGLAECSRLIEIEMKLSVAQVRNAWWDRVEKIRTSKGSGH